MFVEMFGSQSTIWWTGSLLMVVGWMEWPTIRDMVQRAASQYAAHVGETGVMLDKKTAIAKVGQRAVRRWGEVRLGRDRWHLPSGELRPPRRAPHDPYAAEAESGDPTASSSLEVGATLAADPGAATSSSSWEATTSGEATPSDDPGAAISSPSWEATKSGHDTGGWSNHGSSTSSVEMSTPKDDAAAGFYRHGVYHNRPRTPQEQRNHEGGRGARRQARRASRFEEWRKGTWIPAWLKEERDRARAQGHDPLPEEPVKMLMWTKIRLTLCNVS